MLHFELGYYKYTSKEFDDFYKVESVFRHLITPYSP